jgi:phosphatidate phosphatase APP1
MASSSPDSDPPPSAELEPAAPGSEPTPAGDDETPQRRWSLVQEYARTPGRKLVRFGSHLRREARQRMGTHAAPTVVPYIGYGSPHGAARVFARVLEVSQEPPPSVDDSVWVNFKRSYHQWKTSEIPGKRVRITCGGRSVVVESDAEGYVDAWFDTPSLTGPWAPISFTLLDRTSSAPSSASIDGQVFVPPANAELGIISDIDDTILHTNVQDLVRMVTLSVFGNALTRMGYAGTSDWFQGMVRCTGAPTFYVSRSAWNLFPLLRGFIEHQGLPLGPLLLRDVGLRRGKERKRGHKYRRMSEVLEMYPHMRFICIGDSGQRDAEIYASLAESHPGRVAAIYIRDVGNPERRQIAEAACEGSRLPSLVFSDTREALEHSRRHGFWNAP